MKSITYILLICFSLSFVVKASSIRLFPKAGKNIEKTIGDNSGEDNEGTEDSDDSDFELKDKCHTVCADFSVSANTIVLMESVHYHAVHFSFKSTLFLSIFAPPPNVV